MWTENQQLFDGTIDIALFDGVDKLYFQINLFWIY